MTTYYVLFRPYDNMFLRAGRYVSFTYSMNNAKHFTSEWSANKCRERLNDPELYVLKKIQRY